MRIVTIRILLLASLLAAVPQSLAAQADSHARLKPIAFDLALSYNAEYARVAPDTCNCFWMQGGAAEFSATLWKGWGVSAQTGFNVLPGYAPGLDLKKFDFMAGPRYLHRVYALKGSKARTLDLFGEGLFGGAHAYNGAFPSAAGLSQTATSFSLAAGGGADLNLGRSLAWRLFQADYVRTTMPNNYSNTQNDLRLGAGLVIRF